MLKYIEVSGIRDRKDTIIEIKLPTYKFERLEQQEEFGPYCMSQYEFEIIKDWEVFDKPFIERVADIIHQANIDKQQATDFIHTIKCLTGYLFDFPYTRRMEFILEMYRLLNKAHNAGQQKVLDCISKQLEQIELKRSKSKLDQYKAKKLKNGSK